MKINVEMRRRMLTVFLGEFIGTAVLVMIADASAVQHSYQYKEPMFLHIALASGLSLMIALLISGGTSGAHVNPIVTLALAVVGKCDYKEIPVYWLSQYLGAMVGAAITYGIYYDLIDYELQNGLATEFIVSGYFSPNPANFDPSTVTLCFEQILATGVLVVIILSVIDEDNMGVPKELWPLVFGLSLTAILMSFATNGGAAINPARDMGPRLVMWMAYGNVVWKWPETIDEDTCTINDTTGVEICDTTYEYYFWIPWLLPHIGALLGVATYTLFVSMHYEKKDADSDSAKSLK